MFTELPRPRRAYAKNAMHTKWQAYTTSSNKSYYDVKRKIIMVHLVNDENVVISVLIPP